MFLQELFITEGPQTVAFCWGRFQPPHRAHGELFNTLAQVGNYDYWICASQTTGPKDPLDYSTKMDFIRLQHPKLASHVLEDPAIKTIYQAVVAIYNKYDPKVAERLTLVFVGDKTRVSQFVPGFQKFNGVEGKHGYYKFGMITGHETARDADSETDAGVTDPNQDMSKLNPANISGSLVRNLAASGDFDKFKFTVSKTGNEPWVNDLFAALGGKQKAVDENVNEGPSLPSTLKSIATNGEPIAQLYERLKSMAKRWVENNGSLKGYHRNAAGQSAQWFNNFYFNKLQADLYSLVKQAPKAAPPLIAYLKDASEDRDTKINFTEISRSLPPVLFGIGRKIGDESLMRFAKNWNTRREDYENYLSRLEAEAASDDDSDVPSAPKQAKSDAPGKQRSQAEEIVNSVLSKLPKKVAGEIRNAIARAPNKLQALHHELAKRNIQGVAEGSEQNLSIQQLATISDEALDKAYGYGRSTPGNSFGWQANLMSAAYAKKMIDAGVTDIEKISDAIHKGWNVTAQKFVQDPDQFGDTEKLRQAGKLEAKLQQRAKLMKINYAQLDNEEQEKDRVVARALLQAIKGQQGVTEMFDTDVDIKLQQLIKAPDVFNAIYNALGRNDAVGDKLQDMVNDISIDSRLHPDDDIEQIIDIIADRLEADYGVAEADLNRRGFLGTLGKAGLAAAGVGLAGKAQARVSPGPDGKVNDKDDRGFGRGKPDDKDLGNGFELSTVEVGGYTVKAVLDTQTKTYYTLNRKPGDGGAIIRNMAPYIFVRNGQVNMASSVGPATGEAMKKAGLEPMQEGFNSFRNRERNVGVEHERNNYAVYINGKPWKVFTDPQQAMNIAKSLKMKGKDAKVYPTGANPSESIEEATKKPNATTRHLRDYPVSDKDMAKPVKKPEKKKPEQGVSENEKRCPQCGMIGCTCPPGKCKCKPIKGWIPKEVKEEKISVPVTQKPRQGPLRPQTGGGKHRDKKKEQKQGQQKHRQKVVDLGESWNYELASAVKKLIR